jgi:RIO kinase 2
MIVEEVAKAWRLGIIHADLSEFNVMANDEGIKIIDWPQSVERTHPHAEELLKRDLNNVLRFFARKYKLKIDLEETIALVKSQKEAG